MLVAASSAARARTAYDRLDDETLGPDAFGDATGLDDATVERLRAIPGVEGLGRFALVPIAPVPLAPFEDAVGFGALDPDILDTLNRPLVVDGRLAAPDATDEVVINEAMAEASGYGPGDRVTLQAGFDGDVQEVGEATVVGVVRTVFDVGASSGGSVLWLTTAAFDALPEQVRQNVQPNAVVRLADGTDGIDEFTAAVSELLGQPVQVQSAADGEGIVEDTLGVQATGYWLLAAVAALATALAVGQGMARLLGQGFVDLPTMRAIGLRPRDRVLTGVLVVAPVAVAAALVGVAVAWFASDRALTAFARSVDPVTERHLEVGLTAGLVAGWLALVLGVGGLLAWREGRRRADVLVRRHLVPRPPGLLDRLGVDAALRPPGQPGGAAARSALVTASVGVTGLIAVVVFGASLSHLFATPRLQGWSFDAVVQNFEPVTDRQFREQTASLTDDPAVERLAYADLTGVTFDGQAAETLVLAEGANPVQPTIRTGRAASAPDEVVVGSQVLDRTGAALGDTITAEGPAGTLEMTVVGTAAYPMFGNDADTTRLATITRDAARRLGAEPTYNMVLVDLAPGHDPDELAAVAEASASDVIAPFENTSITNLRGVRGFPWFVGAFFALVALTTIAHGILRSVAVRRREFAELAALGLTRRDRRRVVAAQGLTVAVVAAVLGLVLGVVAGQWGWSLLAGALGVVDEAAVPLSRLAAVAVATLAVCLVTAVAAPRLVRLRAAGDLRTPD